MHNQTTHECVSARAALSVDAGGCWAVVLEVVRLHTSSEPAAAQQLLHNSCYHVLGEDAEGQRSPSRNYERRRPTVAPLLEGAAKHQVCDHENFDHLGGCGCDAHVVKTSRHLCWHICYSSKWKNSNPSQLRTTTAGMCFPAGMLDCTHHVAVIDACCDWLSRSLFVALAWRCWSPCPSWLRCSGCKSVSLCCLC